MIEKHLHDIKHIKHWGLNLIDRLEKVNQTLQSRRIDAKDIIKMMKSLIYHIFSFNLRV